MVEYEEKIREIPKEKRVDVDEAGFDSYLYCRHARAPRTSIVAGKIGANIIASLGGVDKLNKIK